MTGTPLTILVDHRERVSGVADQLVRLGVSVELTVLEVGDYVVAEGVGVERKTVRDLHRCVSSRRLWRQVASLRTDFTRAYLVVEGDDIDHGSISPPGIRGCLLAVSDLGVALVTSRSPADTALWLVRMADRHQQSKPRRVARTLPHGATPTPVNVLASLPGISRSTARSLLERFGSIAAVATATRMDLMSVPGVGDRRADTLLRLLAGDAVLR